MKYTINKVIVAGEYDYTCLMRECTPVGAGMGVKCNYHEHYENVTVIAFINTDKEVSVSTIYFDRLDAYSIAAEHYVEANSDEDAIELFIKYSQDNFTYDADLTSDVVKVVEVHHNSYDEMMAHVVKEQTVYRESIPILCTEVERIFSNLRSRLVTE